jgi:hypothetical protein
VMTSHPGNLSQCQICQYCHAQHHMGEIVDGRPRISHSGTVNIDYVKISILDLSERLVIADGHSPVTAAQVNRAINTEVFDIVNGGTVKTT